MKVIDMCKHYSRSFKQCCRLKNGFIALSAVILETSFAWLIETIEFSRANVSISNRMNIS